MGDGCPDARVDDVYVTRMDDDPNAPADAGAQRATTP